MSVNKHQYLHPRSPFVTPKTHRYNFCTCKKRAQHDSTPSQALSSPTSSSPKPSQTHAEETCKKSSSACENRSDVYRKEFECMPEFPVRQYTCADNRTIQANMNAPQESQASQQSQASQASRVSHSHPISLQNNHPKVVCTKNQVPSHLNPKSLQNNNPKVDCTKKHVQDTFAPFGYRVNAFGRKYPAPNPHTRWLVRELNGAYTQRSILEIETFSGYWAVTPHETNYFHRVVPIEVGEMESSELILQR